jgi:hypothetical protein
MAEGHLEVQVSLRLLPRRQDHFHEEPLRRARSARGVHRPEEHPLGSADGPPCGDPSQDGPRDSGHPEEGRPAGAGRDSRALRVGGGTSSSVHRSGPRFGPGGVPLPEARSPPRSARSSWRAGSGRVSEMRKASVQDGVLVCPGAGQAPIRRSFWTSSTVCARSTP